MADAPHEDDALGALLEGWDTPPPREDFVDRVVARVRPEPTPRARRGRVWALAFAAGAACGGLVVALAITGGGSSSPAGLERRTHLHVPGVVDVVGEPGARLQWERLADGELVVDVVEGVAWVRRGDLGAPMRLVAAGDDVDLGGTCGRIQVQRQWLDVDVTVDDVSCGRVEAAIAQALAELSR